MRKGRSSQNRRTGNDDKRWMSRLQPPTDLYFPTSNCFLHRAGAHRQPSRTWLSGMAGALTRWRSGARVEHKAGDWWLERGPRLWCELHRWALTTDRTDVNRWLARFATRIGCGDCRRHWEALMREQPPDFSTNKALFDWTVRMHNAVNRRLNKAEMGVDAAEHYWTDRPCRETDAARVGSSRTAPSRAPCRGCGGAAAAKSPGRRR